MYLECAPFFNKIIKKTYQKSGNPFLITPDPLNEIAKKEALDKQLSPGINTKLYDQSAQSDEIPNLSFICENDRTTICDSLAQQAGFKVKDNAKIEEVDWISQDFEISAEGEKGESNPFSDIINPKES